MSKTGMSGTGMSHIGRGGFVHWFGDVLEVGVWFVDTINTIFLSAMSELAERVVIGRT